MRRYDEPVQVRLSPREDRLQADQVPGAFLWRNRLYVVREVLATWLEREAWWEVPPVHGGRSAYERTVWRVEAGAGRALGTGVYDLAQAVPTPSSVPAMSGAPVGAGTGAVGTGAPGAAGQGEWWLLCHLD